MLYSNKIESQNDLRQTCGCVSQSHVGSPGNQVLCLADPVRYNMFVVVGGQAWQAWAVQLVCVCVVWC
jgi:hypothetical protein